jgi:hypothetical protein
MTAKEAKSNARVAKAQAKALRPWYKKKRFLLPLLLLALILIIVAARSGGDDPGTTAEPAASAASQEDSAPPEKEAPPPEEPAPDNPGIGTPVQSGDLSFTVTKVACGTKRVGTTDLGAKANGQYCLLSLSAENTGDEAATIIGSSQKLLDDKGRQFSADDEASLYVSKDGSNPLIDEINPGNTSKGVLVFDVPKNVKPVSAVLVGGFIGGEEVTVDLKS